MITDILSDHQARVPEFGANNVLALSYPAAVKTGTTRNFRDNWTIGYSPQYVVGVWVGNSDNSQMHDVTGVYGAGPIWRDVMNEIHRGQTKAEFPIPETVGKHTFCLAETYLAVSSDAGCQKTVEEWVPKGRLPEKQTATEKQTADKNQSAPPALRIVSPFDLDEFEFNANIPAETQQIKLQVEKAPFIGPVSWFVNQQKIGQGDFLFWPIQRGEFIIYAVGQNFSSNPPVEFQSEAVRIFVK
jgi:penicillin-binding protein 1C